MNGRLRFRRRVARIVRRLHVRDDKWTFAVYLEDRETTGGREVMRIGRNRHEAAGREPLGVSNVEGVAHSHEERPGEHSDLFIGGMEVRADDVAVGQPEPDREES